MSQKRISEYFGFTGDKTELLNQLYMKIQRCSRCEISRLEVNKYKPWIKFGSVPILVVSQNPSIYRKGRYVQGGLDKLENRIIPELRERFRQALNAVYITNIVKCSTPNNRGPTVEEVKRCLPWLRQEVEIIRPKVLIALGSIARRHVPDFNVKKIEFPHPIAAIRRGEADSYALNFIEVVEPWVK